ncbi:MAG: peptidyl-prolyl cis-trans isomerase [Burkholderiaceae bacterium]
MNPLIRPALTIAGAIMIATSAHAQNAAVVNGKPIPSERVDQFIQALSQQGRPDTPDLRAMVRDELIAQELFVQEAERRGIANGSEVKAQIEDARRNILMRALVRDEVAGNAVSDAEIRAEYDRLTKEETDKEYRARHILVESEDEAKEIIAKLEAGEAFEELAKGSKDPGSAETGGDLDWNTADTFVPEFGEAMVALEKGQVTEEPVKTQFGFHVIRLDDVRDAEAPPLAEVSPQIRQQLERKRVQDLQTKLREAARIE